MKQKISVFKVINSSFLCIVALSCFLPFVNAVAISFSSSNMAATGAVTFWPLDFTLAAYEYVITKSNFWVSFWISIQRVLLGGAVNMLLIVLSAYPLSKTKRAFKARNFFMWYMIVPMVFSGGLIPTYMIVKETGLMDKIWALVLPVGLPLFNVILMMNFFRELPQELEEAAFMDGASHWRILTNIYLPITKASLATVLLLVFVFHWNSWFDGMLYMTNPSRTPMQTYIRSITTLPLVSTGMSMEMVKLIQLISNRTTKCAQIVIGSIPIISVYPFLQKYFVKGMTLGSVKA